MPRGCLRAAAVILCLASDPAVAGLTYRLTEGMDACREIHLGSMTPPPGQVGDAVDSGNCRYDIRSPGEGSLYISAECSRGDMIPIQEKFAIDLIGKNSVRRISDAEWASAYPMAVIGGALLDPNKDETGVRYKDGPLLERSGPKWSGVGLNIPIRARLDPSHRWAAVYSWDGFNIPENFMNPSSFSLRQKIRGDYWIDIFNAASGQRLLKMTGSFKGISPDHFLGFAPGWYGDRYFVMPLGKAFDGGASVLLNKLLICDAEAASRKQEPGLQKRK
jgi:hypothetical protein